MFTYTAKNITIRHEVYTDFLHALSKQAIVTFAHNKFNAFWFIKLYTNVNSCLFLRNDILYFFCMQTIEVKHIAWVHL